MKKIGFIDYYIDEWHANNYPGWIRENAAKHKRGADVAYAWAEMNNPGGLDTKSWCEKYNVAMLSSAEEIVDKSDYLIVLSPDNPERHERLSRIPLMSGKPVYVDKTFSPDLQTGVRMFELAEKYKTPMYSSSALRFTKELSEYPNDKVNSATLEFVAARGPGRFENYAVHQLEMIVKLMGPGVKRLKSLSTANAKSLAFEYKDGRRASMLQMKDTPFQISMQLKNGDGVSVGECSDFFPRFINAMLDFFKTGEAPVHKEETLEIMALMDAGNKALMNYDAWIDV